MTAENDGHIRSAIAALKSADIAEYLAATGWDQTKFEAGHSSTWTNSYEGERVELMLPLNSRFKDFNLRSREAVSLLAAVERRPVVELLTDLQTAGSDGINDRLRSASADDDYISFKRIEGLSEIQGAVVQLRRQEQSGPAAGPVIVMALVERKPRRVQISLDEAGHQIALDAYRQGSEIACTGDLIRQGNFWVLQNPKGLTIVTRE